MKRVNKTLEKQTKRETIDREAITENGNYNNISKLEEKESKQQQIMREVKLQRIRDNIKLLQKETLHTIDDQMSALMDGVIGELEKYEKMDSEDIFFNSKAIPEKKPRGHNVEKCFIARASPLSELLEVRHIRSLYHIFIAALVISLISGAIGDALVGGLSGIRIGIRLLPRFFSDINRAIILWLFLFSTTCFIHPLLSLWINLRPNTNRYLLWIYDRLCIFLSFVYVSIIGALVIYNTTPEMGPGTCFIIFCEQTRFLMKIHAFLRSNIPRYPSIPSFYKYLYFLFAPTLVYRDNYPKTSHIRWKFVGTCMTEFFGALMMQSCISEFHFLPEFSRFGLEKQTAGSLAASVSRSVLPGSLLFLCGFYLLLHAWMNIWAELLRFADRRFYAAWWNATSYGEYYRTWNCVVHDYLYEYIFRDVLVLTKSSTVAKIAVFAVSAIFHEYIIAFTLGFCYPVMFIQFFGIGAVLGFVRGHGRCANIFLWGSLASGLGMQFSLYNMEAFARINCPKNNSDFIDYFIPRSWTCNGLDL